MTFLEFFSDFLVLLNKFEVVYKQHLVQFVLLSTATFLCFIFFFLHKNLNYYEEKKTGKKKLGLILFKLLYSITFKKMG